METTPPVLQLIKEILREDPRAAIVLAEILGSPPGLADSPPKLWEEG
jgi:hypothetical protein